MDYEQKYKAALEAVKFLQEVNPSDEGIQNWVNDNFPELKEPKEEQIRKRLIKTFESMAKEQWGGIAIKDILTWLEKLAVKDN